MRNSFLFVLFIFSLGCKAQKNSSPDRIKAFLNWYVTQIKEPTVVERSAALDTVMIAHFAQLGLGPNDTIKLSGRDSMEILSQIRLGTLTYSAEYFPNKKMITVTEEKAQVRTGLYLFARVSRPVFFGNRVFVYVEHFCGVLCGSGMFEVYEEDDVGYKPLFRKPTWIS